VSCLLAWDIHCGVTCPFWGDRALIYSCADEFASGSELKHLNLIIVQCL